MNMQRASVRRSSVACLALALAGAMLLASPGSAQRTAEPATFVAAAARTVAEPRPVAAVIAQPTIGTSIELGRIMGANGGGGGALGAILVMAMDRTPQRLAAGATARAEAQVAPIRAALSGFDTNALAVDATRSAVSGLGWFNAGPTELRTSLVAAEGAPWIRRAVAEAHPAANQFGVVEWRYQMSPDFSQVQVIAIVELTDRARMSSVYRQQLISIVRLDTPSYVAEQNVARWSANGGQPIRRALDRAFARAGQAIALILDLDQPGYRHATDRRRADRVVAVGYHGPVLLQDAAGPIIWATDSDQNLAAFVAVQTASE